MVSLCLSVLLSHLRKKLMQDCAESQRYLITISLRLRQEKVLDAQEKLRGEHYLLELLLEAPVLLRREFRRRRRLRRRRRSSGAAAASGMLRSGLAERAPVAELRQKSGKRRHQVRVRPEVREGRRQVLAPERLQPGQAERRRLLVGRAARVAVVVGGRHQAGQVEAGQVGQGRAATGRCGRSCRGHEGLVLCAKLLFNFFALFSFLH